ncbi:NACHT domain-containing protein [Actinokineospora diospyrosa]|uniref:Uncharacterized protein n=1 Tax=Actinokineospora diospyrosa TaxID=103728 RepID=A0ABT1I6D7_9PSEU|nr:hypothetical protein [Actinokineospora diospyrosa]MCP2268144.1 hypothetical protein [Actinokineospora diospyrosa]
MGWGGADRLEGILAAPLVGALRLQTRQFTPKQVQRFVRRWYRAVERLSIEGTDEEVNTRADELSADLLDKLHGAPGLADFTANPLLLTMIANVHRFRGALPGSRADLYREICQVMLWRRQEAKKLPVALAGEKKEQMLRALAFRMMTAGVTELRRDDVLAEFAPTLRKLSTPLTAADVVADASSNGLLVEREAGLYAFAHKTFQEYLAAAHIREHKLDELIYRVDDAYWEETTLLYTAEADADDIIRACLISGSPNALSLAYKCLEQGDALALEPALRQELANLLDTKRFEQATAQQRRATATILANRYVAGWAHPRRGTRIADRPVPASLYRLFELEIGVSEPVGGDLDGVCSGVPGYRAQQFCLWFNSVLDSDQTYRLPRRRELEGQNQFRGGHPVWTVDQALGVWAFSGQPHLVTEESLWATLLDDLDAPSAFLLLVLHAVSAARTQVEGGRAKAVTGSELVYRLVRAALRVQERAGQDWLSVASLEGGLPLLTDFTAAVDMPYHLAAVADLLVAAVERVYPAAGVLHPLIGPLDGLVDQWQGDNGFAFAVGLRDVTERTVAKMWLNGSAFTKWSGWDAPPEALDGLLLAVLAAVTGQIGDRWSRAALTVLHELRGPSRATRRRSPSGRPRPPGWRACTCPRRCATPRATWRSG